MTYSSSSGNRKCVRLRVTNSSTSRSKNLRIAASMFDDSIHELIHDNPDIKDSGVLKWSSEEEQQIQEETGQIQYVMKRHYVGNIVLTAEEIEKTSLQDLVEFQKDDIDEDGVVSDDNMINIILQFTTASLTVNTIRPSLDSIRMDSVRSFSDSIRSSGAISPSILKNENSPSVRKSVTFKVQEHTMRLPVE